MSRLDPAVALVRRAVEGIVPAGLRPKIDERRPLGEIAEHGQRAVPTAPGEGVVSTEPSPSSASLILVACSGGADSMALAAAAAFVAPRLRVRWGVVTVDHQLQVGSGLRAREVVKWAESVGAEVAEGVTVSVGSTGGPEAAARDARYAALVEAAQRRSAWCVLLGHTEDDQAETVLLALARGSGPRGIAGMPTVSERGGVRFVRPLLGVSRATCRAACEAQGLPVWDDPHNVDHSYARARVRSTVMPTLADALGADVVPNLARTASLVAADNRYLDEIASKALEECRSDAGLEVACLAAQPDPIRSRVLHLWATSLGVPRAALSHRHVAAMDALVTGWHGQGATQLPGGISVFRSRGALSYSRS